MSLVLVIVLSVLSFLPSVDAKPMPANPEVINAYLAKINAAVMNKLTIKEQKNLTAASYKKIYSDTMEELGYNLNESLIEITQKYLEEDYTQMEAIAVSVFITTVFYDSQEIAIQCRDGNVISSEAYNAWEKGFYKRHPEKDPNKKNEQLLGIGSKPNVKINDVFGLKSLNSDQKNKFFIFIEKYFSDKDFQAAHSSDGIKRGTIELTMGGEVEHPWQPFIVDFNKPVTISFNLDPVSRKSWNIEINGRGYTFVGNDSGGPRKLVKPISDESV